MARPTELLPRCFLLFPSLSFPHALSLSPLLFVRPRLLFPSYSLLVHETSLALSFNEQPSLTVHAGVYYVLTTNRSLTIAWSPLCALPAGAEHEENPRWGPTKVGNHVVTYVYMDMYVLAVQVLTCAHARRTHICLRRRGTTFGGPTFSPECECVNEAARERDRMI